MDKDKHIVIADSQGYFYCRAVDSVLNYEKEQQVCGRGCPCYTGHQNDAQGQLLPPEALRHPPSAPWHNSLL